MPRPLRKENIFVPEDQAEEIRDTISQRLRQELANIFSDTDGIIDEDFQRSREEELKFVDYLELLEKTRNEANKKQIFKEQYCSVCIRRNICIKIGSLYDCSLFSKDDIGIITNRRRQMRGV